MSSPHPCCPPRAPRPDPWDMAGRGRGKSLARDRTRFAQVRAQFCKPKNLQSY